MLPSQCLVRPAGDDDFFLYVIRDLLIYLKIHDQCNLGLYLFENAKWNYFDEQPITKPRHLSFASNFLFKSDISDLRLAIILSKYLLSSWSTVYMFYKGQFRFWLSEAKYFIKHFLSVFFFKMFVWNWWMYITIRSLLHQLIFFFAVIARFTI